jgi:subtilase family serine protease
MDIQAAHAIAPQARLVYVNLTSFGGKNASAPATFLRAFATVARDYPGPSGA